MIAEVAYNLIATVATIAYVVVPGFVALFLVLGARSPTNGLAVIALKVVLGACFGAGLVACIYLWSARSWAVVAVPFIGLAAQLALNWFGQTVLHWSVSMGFV